MEKSSKNILFINKQPSEKTPHGNEKDQAGKKEFQSKSGEEMD